MLAEDELSLKERVLLLTVTLIKVCVCGVGGGAGGDRAVKGKEIDTVIIQEGKKRKKNEIKRGQKGQKTKIERE